MSEEKEILLERVREFEARTGHTVDSFPDDPNNTASALNERRYLSEPMADEEARRQMSAKSRRSFLAGGAAAIIGIMGWRWMDNETKTRLFRRAFEFNEKVSLAFFSPKQLAKEFRPDKVTPARTNGFAGIEGELDVSAWTLAVGGLAGRADDLILTLDDIKKLPRTEMITEFKCIEGWSYIVKWGGVRFSDFAAKYPPKTQNGSEPDVVNRPHELVQYVSMNTPDAQYYVGWDMPSILHPQTLLAYEMNDEPLKSENGAPLRIASPTKYGIKQIKRVGRIDFTNERPKDFWAEPQWGYDWYAGH
jgi:DMSO/TMAO reductase YedYZ molybdopterin-dependent catalytic subunit